MQRLVCTQAEAEGGKPRKPRPNVATLLGLVQA